MSTASAVLIAIAKELARQAKDNLPKLQEGEEVQREWFEDGIYYRESLIDGSSYISQFDFKNRESRRVAAGGNKNVRGD